MSAAATVKSTDSKAASHAASMAIVGWPKRCFIQKFDEVPPDYQLVADEMKLRGIPVAYKTTEDILRLPWDLTKNDLVVGNFDWTRLACQKLKIPLPHPPDYPACLQHLLHRKVWASTLGEVQAYLKQPEHKGESVFIKPAATAKAFAAIVEPKDAMLDTFIDGIPDGVMEPLPKSTPVWCSTLVDMISEFRVYVVDGVVRATVQYRGDVRDETHKLDASVVNGAIAALSASEEGRDLTGYGIDFAVVKKAEKEKKDGKEVVSYITCLVEVNDGYSLGRYKGLAAKDYTDLLLTRWARLVGFTKPPAATTAAATATSASATSTAPTSAATTANSKSSK